MPPVRVVRVDGFEIEIRDARAIEPGGLDEIVPLKEMERRYTRFVLARCGGNKSRAARALGIDRRSVYRLLETENPSALCSDSHCVAGCPAHDDEDGLCSRTGEDEPEQARRVG